MALCCLALRYEFGGNKLVLLNGAPHFYAKDLWEFVSGERSTEYIEDTGVERVVSESLEVWCSPRMHSN